MWLWRTLATLFLSINLESYNNNNNTKFLFSDWSKAHHVRPRKYWYWAATADIGQFQV